MKAELQHNSLNKRLKTIPQFTYSLSDLQSQQKQQSSLIIQQKLKDINQLSGLFEKQIEKIKSKKKLRIPGKIVNLKEQIISSLLQVFRPSQHNKFRAFQQKKDLVCAAIDTVYTSKYKQSYNSIAVQNPQQNNFNLFTNNHQKELRSYSSHRKLGSIKKYNIQRFSTPNNKRSASSTRVGDSGVQRFRFRDYYQSIEKKINFDREQIKYSPQQIENFRKRSGMIK